MHGSPHGSPPPSPRALSERRAVGCALLAVALWSTVATGFKLGLEVLAPLQLLLLGTAVSTAVFWIAAVRGGRYRLRPAAVRRAALFGLVNPFAYYLVLFDAYERLPAQIAQPLNYTWAITLAVLAVPLLGQRLAARTLAGILVSYAGVVLLLTQGRFDGLPQLDWLGVALALGSTVLWAGYWLMGTRSAADPLGLMAWSFLWATIAVAAVCRFGPGWPPLTPRTVFYGSWVGLVEMGFTYLLWQRALRSTQNAARIGQLIFLSPFVSFVLIDTVLGEQVRMSSVVGLVIIVAGLSITAPLSSARVP